MSWFLCLWWLLPGFQDGVWVATCHQIPPTSTCQQSLRQRNKFIEHEQRWDLSGNRQYHSARKFKTPLSPLDSSAHPSQITAWLPLHSSITMSLRSMEEQDMGQGQGTLLPTSAACAPQWPLEPSWGQPSYAASASPGSHIPSMSFVSLLTGFLWSIAKES